MLVSNTKVSVLGMGYGEINHIWAIHRIVILFLVEGGYRQQERRDDVAKEKCQ